MANNVLKDKDNNILNPKIPRYENLKNYSEEEQLVGNYLSRPLYRKVVECGLITVGLILLTINGLVDQELIALLLFVKLQLMTHR